MKQQSNAALKKKLWKIFAAYIKERDGRICFTCGKKTEGANSQAGHFIPKAAGGLALYFHEDNVHVQCAACNLFLEGNHYIYGQKLGRKIVNKLYKIKEQIIKDYPFEEKIAYYTKILNEIKSADFSSHW